MPFSLPVRRSPTIMVAASNASDTEKAVAHYICDGTADDVQIQAAITALPSTGGAIQLSSGTFTIAAAISISKNPVFIFGAGNGRQISPYAEATVIKIAANTNINAFANADTTTRNLNMSYLALDGNKTNQSGAGGSGILWNYLALRLYEVNCHDFKVDGITTTGGLVVSGQFSRIYLFDNTGNGMNAGGADGLVQGMEMTFPNWIYGNGKVGVFVRGNQATTGYADSIVEAYVESNDHEGLIARDMNRSIIRVLAIGNGGPGLRLQGDLSGTTVHFNGNGNGTTGGSVASRKAEMHFLDLTAARVHAVIPRTGSGVDGVLLEGDQIRWRIMPGSQIDGPRYTFGEDATDAPVFTDCYVTECDLAGASGIFASGNPDTDDLIIRRCTGYVTEFGGVATIANGATTTGNVAHGISETPGRGEIVLVPIENPTNTPGLIWVDSIDGTNFVAMCENDPGASGLDLRWSIRRI